MDTVEMSKYRTPEYRERHAKHARAHNKKNPEMVRERHNRWKKNNPERYRILQQKASLKKKYGITIEERDLILASQHGRCAICRTDKPTSKGWFVDHCHLTNRVRGILCQHCNSVLGYSMERETTLKAAIKYLKRGLLLNHTIPSA